MDSESTSSRQQLQEVNPPSGFKPGEDSQEGDDEDPYSWNGPSNALLGLAIAITSIGVPLLVVLIDQPPSNEKTVPSALEPYGSKSSSSISFARFS
ncbi:MULTISPECIES: hypothetical protein [Prochlorococcus]|uniref:hypothetical protein n=1 Tax=Prochlorococcus TaxID=1218 RepID=UPI00056D9BE4|nr:MULTISPECIES: hypothetical protein [Prochlorococcus]